MGPNRDPASQSPTLQRHSRAKIRAMLKRSLACIALMIALPCTAQVLTPSEHRDLLKKLDRCVPDWVQRIELLDIEKLNVSYSVGKNLEQEKDIILQNLSFMRKAIAQQLIQNRLSTDISLESSLEDVMNFSRTLLDSLPETAEAARWSHSVPDPKEFEPFTIPLMKHILSSADRLQKNAEDCSR